MTWHESMPRFVLVKLCRRYIVSWGELLLISRLSSAKSYFVSTLIIFTYELGNHSLSTENASHTHERPMFFMHCSICTRHCWTMTEFFFSPLSSATLFRWISCQFRVTYNYCLQIVCSVSLTKSPFQQSQKTCSMLKYPSRLMSLSHISVLKSIFKL